MKTILKNRTVWVTTLAVVVCGALATHEWRAAPPAWTQLSEEERAVYANCMQAWKSRQQGDVRPADFYGTSECMAELAISKHDVEVCTLISPLDQMGMTQFFCIQTYALATDDPQICVQNLSDRLQRATCITTIAKKRNDISLCEVEKHAFKTSDQTYFSDSCYDEFAVERSDASLCKKMVNRTGTDVSALCRVTP